MPDGPDTRTRHATAPDSFPFSGLYPPNAYDSMSKGAPRQNKKEKGDEKNGRLHTEYQREECGPQTCGTHRGHQRVQRDDPVRYPEQPVRVCIVYELGRQPPARRKDKGGLHGKDRVPGRGCEDRRQGCRHLRLDRRFAAGIAAIIANTANTTAHGGTPAHNSDGDGYSATLRCHDPNGELFYVNFSRQQVTISSYEDDGIRNRIETWADSAPALA